MCFKAASPSIAELIEYLESQPGYTIDDTIEPYYFTDGFDFPKLPVSIQGYPQRIIPMRWGLLPKWFDLLAARQSSVKEQIEKMQAKGRMVTDHSLIRPKGDGELIKAFTINTLNARAEEVFNKPSWSNSIMTRRCIVYTTGFYEFRHLDNGKVKLPYFIYPQTAKVAAMGGLWSSWTHPETGEMSHGFAVITVPANILLSKIHNSKLRMPLVFDKVQARQWLDPALDSQQIQQLMQPCLDDFLKAHTIGNLLTQRISKEEKNTPLIQAMQEYPEWIALR